MKKIVLSLFIVCVLSCTLSMSAFATSPNEDFIVIPQTLETIIEHNENGEIYYECRWSDNTGAATLSALDDAEWVHHTFGGLPLKHRAAKEYSTTSNSVRAASQTDYQLRHYSRAQIVVALIENVLVDSGREYVNSGMATARSPYILNDWGYALRSYWG